MKDLTSIDNMKHVMNTEQRSQNNFTYTHKLTAYIYHTKIIKKPNSDRKSYHILMQLFFTITSFHFPMLF